MSWFYYALFFAIVSSVNSVIFKSLTKKIHQFSIALASLLFGLPFLLLVVLHFYQIPKVDYLFWLGVSGSAFLNIFATIFSFTALRLSDVSILAPISAFNPVFTAIISFLILKETPTFQGLIGIVLVGLGGYFLNISAIKQGWLMPIKKLLSDRGVQLMFITYIIWAITPIFEKTAINHTNPQVPPFVSLVSGPLLILGIAPLTFLKVKRPVREILENWKIFTLTGLIGALAQAAALIAFSLAFLGYATAVFKTSMFFTIILAYIFLKEKGIKNRLLGAVFMFAGVLLLVL